MELTLNWELSISRHKKKLNWELSVFMEHLVNDMTGKVHRLLFSSFNCNWSTRFLIYLVWCFSVNTVCKLLLYVIESDDYKGIILAGDQPITLVLVLVCSLRTSETSYLNEAFSFYSAIRQRSYYFQVNKEDRWAPVPPTPLRAAVCGIGAF